MWTRRAKSLATVGFYFCATNPLLPFAIAHGLIANSWMWLYVATASLFLFFASFYLALAIVSLNATWQFAKDWAGTSTFEFYDSQRVRTEAPASSTLRFRLTREAPIRILVGRGKEGTLCGAKAYVNPLGVSYLVVPNDPPADDFEKFQFEHELAHVTEGAYHSVLSWSGFINALGCGLFLCALDQYFALALASLVVIFAFIHWIVLHPLYREMLADSCGLSALSSSEAKQRVGQSLVAIFADYARNPVIPEFDATLKWTERMLLRLYMRVHNLSIRLAYRLRGRTIAKALVSLRTTGRLRTLNMLDARSILATVLLASLPVWSAYAEPAINLADVFLPVGLALGCLIVGHSVAMGLPYLGRTVRSSPNWESGQVTDYAFFALARAGAIAEASDNSQVEWQHLAFACLEQGHPRAQALWQLLGIDRVASMERLASSGVRHTESRAPSSRMPGNVDLALEIASQEAQRMGQSRIDVEELLLGVFGADNSGELAFLDGRSLLNGRTPEDRVLYARRAVASAYDSHSSPAFSDAKQAASS